MNILKKLISGDPNKKENSVRKDGDKNNEVPQEPANEFRILNQRHIDQLQSEQKEERELIIKELVSMGDPIVDDLIIAIEEWYKWSKSDALSITFRISLAQALGQLGDAKAINPLIKMADRIEKTVKHRETAAESLALIGQMAYKPMLELLESNDPASQQLAAWTLGKMGNSNAIEYLIPLLSKQPFHYPHVRAAANKALAELTGQNFGEDTELWKKWMEDNPGD